MNNGLSKNIAALVDVVKKGGVVIFPTETVYALACDATNSESIEKIYQIKLRDQNSPLSLLVYDLSIIESYAYVSSEVKKLIDKFSPGPITYVLEIKDTIDIPQSLIKAHAVGFRIPEHTIALEILRQCNVPLVGTSVNRSGALAATSVQKIDPEIKDQVDFILDDGESKIGMGSTVVSIAKDGAVKILREGAISEQEILTFLENSEK